MWQKLSRCYPLQLELVSLFLLVLVFYIALSNYSALPNTIPTHFNAQGIPDDWGSKGTIFRFPILSALLIFFPITVANIWFALVDDPKKLINLPKKRKEALTEAQAETLRIVLNRGLFTLKFITLSLFTYLTWRTVEVAQGNADNLGTLPWLFLGVIFLVAGCMIWKSFSLTKTST